MSALRGQDHFPGTCGGVGSNTGTVAGIIFTAEAGFSFDHLGDQLPDTQSLFCSQQYHGILYLGIESDVQACWGFMAFWSCHEYAPFMRLYRS